MLRVDCWVVLKAALTAAPLVAMMVDPLVVLMADCWVLNLVVLMAVWLVGYWADSLVDL